MRGRAARIPLVAGGALAALACATAIGGCGRDEPSPAREAGKAARAATALRGSPPKLAAIHRQANRLLPGGDSGFEARLAELRGYPVVVNKWASWCGPCRHEFPFFQSQAVKRGKRVAFLGVNSNDGPDSARDFLKRFPVPYPSYEDPKLEVAAVFKAPTEFPATAFYDRRGRLAFVKKGGYDREAELAADIRRYAR